MITSFLQLSAQDMRNLFKDNSHLLSDDFLHYVEGLGAQPASEEQCNDAKVLIADIPSELALASILASQYLFTFEMGESKPNPQDDIFIGLSVPPETIQLCNQLLKI